VRISSQLSASARARAARPWRWITGCVARVTVAEWWLLGLVALCYCYFLSPANTNSISRYDMVWALAHGTAIIDPNAANTIDVSFYHGHYYSPRSVGLSLLAVPVLLVVRLAETVLGRQNFLLLAAQLVPAGMGHERLTIEIAVFNLICVVPAALAAVLVFHRFVLRLRPALRGAPALFVTGAFALGTLFFPFATVFFSHALGAALLFIAFYLLYRARASSHAALLVLVAGLCAGLGVLTEYPAALLAALLAGYLWLTASGQRLQLLALFGAGALPAVLALGWYDWLAFGNPFHVSYEYVAVNQLAGQHSGLFGITFPRLSGYAQTLLWPRGLLVESPFLIFVPLGLYRWLRAGARPSPEALLCVAACVVYPSLVASYFLPMAGENLPGPRLLVPVLPFACLALAWVVDDARRWVRALFAALTCFGVLVSFLYIATGVREYHTYATYPLTDLYWPVLSTGYVPHTNGDTPPNLGSLFLHLPQGVSIYVPLIALVVALVWALRAWLRTPEPQAADTAVQSVEPRAPTQTEPKAT